MPEKQSARTCGLPFDSRDKRGGESARERQRINFVAFSMDE